MTEQQTHQGQSCGGGCFGSLTWRAQDTRRFDESDAEIAREINALSVEERERMLEEIHGVRTDLEETPEIIAESLKRFEKALSSVHPRKRKAMDRAMFLNPNLRNNEKMALMFLRANQHSADIAAKYMAEFYEHKRLLFGDDKLPRSITLDDLDAQDLELFQEGRSCLMLPNTDSAGRPVMFFNMGHLEPKKVSNLIRCIWYTIMAALENEATQIKGVCAIDCHFRDMWKQVLTIPDSVELLKKVGKVTKILPMRPTSYHFCSNNHHMKMLISAARIALGRQARLRLRPHFGTTLEVQYSLMTFGIRQSFLFENAGKPGLTRLQRDFLERRKDIERREKERQIRLEAETGIIYCPDPLDVLIGRGRPYQAHLGNLIMSQLIDARMDKYHSGDRFEKTCISMEIAHRVREGGGRFLQRTSGGWKPLDDKIAREKVASVFRTKALKPSTGTTKSNSAAINGGDLLQFDPPSKRIRSDPTSAMN